METDHGPLNESNAHISNLVSDEADALNALLADSFVLYVKTKNFHWHMTGLHFRDYHLMLDEHAAEILSTTDAIAERVRKNGKPTLRSIGDIARRQRIKDNDADNISPDVMLKELHVDNEKLIAAPRDAKTITDRVSDSATSGLIDNWLDLAERRVWFLSQTMGGG